MKIVEDPRIDHEDPRVRAAAEDLHRNESLHLHHVEGIVCVYCALRASRVVRTLAAHVAEDFAPRPALVQVGSRCERCGVREWHDEPRRESTLHSSLCGPFPKDPPPAERVYVLGSEPDE